VAGRGRLIELDLGDVGAPFPAGAGRSRRMADVRAAAESPRNGRSPVASSYSKTPSEKRSVR
jgi:hypothetical protein